uniref:GPI mannosyltransferase 2 n=1 Tax=Lactuca sativa TaxID=4236 RepID=A0A9R1UHI9_LACSA|nr:hypothetical protein LSAT_V11C900496090 [Lactuca sativa]
MIVGQSLQKGNLVKHNVQKEHTRVFPFIWGSIEEEGKNLTSSVTPYSSITSVYERRPLQHLKSPFMRPPSVRFNSLSVIILKDSEASLRASILFCFHPTSIFFSSIYSESLYAVLSIGGIYFLISGANLLALSSLAFSVLSRSNWVLNACYIGFQTIHRAYDVLPIKVLIYVIMRRLFVFCSICWISSIWISQGAGFLKYFQLKQLPNFLLASRILSIAIWLITHYVKLQPEAFFSLGFQVAPKSNVVDRNNTRISTTTQEYQTLKRRKHSTKEEEVPTPSVP